MTAKTASDPAKGQGLEAVDDVEVILAESKSIEIAGVPCAVKRMKTRELLKLMRIITQGMGGSLALVQWNTEDEVVLMGQLTAVVLNAVPNAEDEVITFLNVMVEPEGSVSKKKQAEFAKTMKNPPMEVTMELIEIVIEQEAGELAALGKQAVGWWKATGVIDKMKETRV